MPPVFLHLQSHLYGVDDVSRRADAKAAIPAGPRAQVSGLGPWPEEKRRAKKLNFRRPQKHEHSIFMAEEMLTGKYL